MLPDAYFMHCIFEANPDEIRTQIEGHCEQMILIDGQILIPRQRIGNQVTWVYDQETLKTSSIKLLNSTIDIVSRGENSEFTEVRIVLTIHPHIFHHFELLAYDLWSKYPVVKDKLTLPQYDEEPDFKSAADYDIELAEFAKECDEFWNEEITTSENNDINSFVEESDPYEKLYNQSEMKKHFQGYNVKTARKIIEALPDAYDKYLFDGDRWGPGVIANYCYLNSTTVGRYLKAFSLAGVTVFHLAGVNEIPNPYKSKTQS